MFDRPQAHRLVVFAAKEVTDHHRSVIVLVAEEAAHVDSLLFFLLLVGLGSLDSSSAAGSGRGAAATTGRHGNEPLGAGGNGVSNAGLLERSEEGAEGVLVNGATGVVQELLDVTRGYRNG